jgi:hypothetical protein
MSLYTFAEVFHGCKQSADFFIQFVKNSSLQPIYVILENLSPRDAKIIQNLRENNQFNIETFRDHLIDKRGLLMGYILKRIHKLKNVIILGIDEALDDKRYDQMYKILIEHLKDGKHMVYYGFHLGYNSSGPQKNILNRNLKKKYDIQTFAMFSSNIKTILLTIDEPRPTKDEKKFELENEIFSKHEEAYHVKNINPYIPPTSFELKYQNKGIKIIKSPRNEFFRQAGIWFGIYKGNDHLEEILDYYCSTKIYDYMIHLPKADYLL